MSKTKLLDKIDKMKPLTVDSFEKAVSKTVIDSESTFEPVDEMYTEVKHNGRLRYKIIEDNFYDNGKLVRPDSTEISGESGDACDVKSKYTKLKCGVSNAGKTIGIKRRSDDKQFLVTASELIGFNGPKNVLNAKNRTVLDMDKYVQFSHTFTGSGVENHTLFSKDLPADHNFKYYGIIYNINDVEVMQEIQPDITTMFKIDRSGKYFIEYFSIEEFQTQDKNGNYGLPYHDYQNNYTTISGGLSAHTTWTTGTYLLSNDCPLNNYNLTLDCVGGDIIIKDNGGDEQLQVSGSGNLITSNTSETNKVYFTSKNDDSKGETITGSTGTPAKGDTVDPWIQTYGSGCIVNLDFVEFWYCESPLGILNFRWTTDQTSNDITLNHIVTKYCGLPSGLSVLSSLIGRYRYLKASGDVDIQNISIDSTNSIKDNSLGYGIYINEAQTLTFSNNYIDIATADECYMAVRLYDIETASTVNIKNNFIRSKSAYASLYVVQAASQAVTFNVRHNDIIQNGGAGNCTEIVRAGGTVTVNCYDNIIMGAPTGVYGINVAGTMTFNEGNNGYYNNDTDANGFTPTNPISADPDIGNLPGGAIASNYFLPDGFAVRNLTDYEKQGSDTFDNLSIDESKYTMTGYEYVGTDKVTPGVYYEMSAFISGGGIFFFFDD